jgi:tRNA-dihydrouridine synthase B
MLSIGSVTLSGPLVLAPLAGYSDLPFRHLCREFGAGLCVSEMISCHGLSYRQERTLSMLASSAEERPVSFQLFGADPVVMGEAAALLDSCGPDLIDINMGCPVKKVTRRGAGAALMKDIKQAEAVVNAVVSNSSRPVTLKIRTGVNSAAITAVDFAKMAEANGIAALCVHGRTWKQGFSGMADWRIIKELRETISIPLFGNGDITSSAQARTRMQETGCDGVYIGRGAIGNPWVFSRDGRPANLSSIVAVVRRHLDLIEHHTSTTEKGVGSLKNHLGKYFKGFPGCAQIRKTIYQQRDFASLRSYMAMLAENGHSTASIE